MLRNVIWTRFFTKPICWQNSVVIFEKSYLAHMTSFLAKIWSVDRSFSQESKTNLFCINWTSVDPDIQVGMAKCQHWQIARFDFEGFDFHALSYCISCLICLERYGYYLFNVTGITSFWSLKLTLCTKHWLTVKFANYLQFTSFCIFHPKVPSKHKTKNIKAFYK
jgi:hypothetical protein